jgi:tRNA-specific adenosine deaminase 1
MAMAMMMMCNRSTRFLHLRCKVANKRNQCQTTQKNLNTNNNNNNAINNKVITTKRTSSTSSAPDKKSKHNNEIGSVAKEISALFNLDARKGMEIAQSLSASTRNELSQLNKTLSQRVSSSSSTTSTRTTVTQEPNYHELRLHALTCGIPFIGFGIMDNAILIWAGDQIDTHLGVLFGISTLCAAAIGNIISDIAGVGLGGVIEDFCATKLRMPKVNFTNAQRSLRSVRFAGQLGNMIGLTIGCIIGMFPLLYIDSDHVQHMKKEAHMDQIFKDVVSEAKTLIGAESTCLYLVVDNEDENINRPNHPNHHPAPFTPNLNDGEGYFLFAKYETDNVIAKTTKNGMKEPINRGIVGRAASTGKVTMVSE